MDGTAAFEAQRPRLVGLAARVLGDRAEAEDVVQQAWLRLHRSGAGVEDLPAWLTTVTTRLCLDRLRARVPTPSAQVEVPGAAPDPAEDLALAETVGIALQVVLDRLSPPERVAFVLHDNFGVEHATIAAILGTTAVAARKLASRARAKVAPPRAGDALADWQVVDAFMAAARGGDLAALLRLLAPEAAVTADDAAVMAGTPARIEGREQVAAFFDGSASAALAVLIDGRPGAAWFHRGRAMVAFDLTIADALVRQVTFRAAPEVLARVVRREGQGPRPAGGHTRHGATVTEEMRSRWRHPERSTGWNRRVEATFEGLPDA